MPATPASAPRPVDLAVESVAGEEDPGAALDLPATNGPRACPTCGGDGQLNGGACPDCDGTGELIAGR